MNTEEILSVLSAGGYDKRLAELYTSVRTDEQKKRYSAAVESFEKLYGVREVSIFSVAGRSEISGNHTDHNKGCVLAASINLDIIAVVSKTDDGIIRVKSEGFDEDVYQVSSTAYGNKYSSKAIIAGVCDGLNKNGFTVGGFCAYTTSSVLKGSGLSSSAAFEDMIGFILSNLYNGGKIPNVEIAKISQYAENAFFGKPCGLMDQVACAVGGFVFIDFGGQEPVIEPVAFDLYSAGYDLCIVNTGGNHADLNEDYASVPADMKAAASLFGQKVLRTVTEDEYLCKLPEIREKLGDRAALRGIHFIRENKRVINQAKALKDGDLQTFLKLAIASGDSSYKYLQNVYTVKNPTEQGLSVALCVTEGLLSGTGAAWRVHGGGFAGTIQVFIKRENTEKYKTEIEKIFGKGSCAVLSVRAEGCAVVVK